LLQARIFGRARESKTVGFGPEVAPDYSRYLAQAAKIVGVGDDLEAVARCEKRVQDELSDHVSAARSQPYYLDVTHPPANKGSVVDFLAAVYLIPRTSIATLGDMPNDLLKFHKSGMSIAMGNASKEVQSEANFVTGSNEARFDRPFTNWAGESAQIELGAFTARRTAQIFDALRSTFPGKCAARI
jgi:hydroxymethylpyrimidine pyrophosphatase-like HAD family hydrolase